MTCSECGEAPRTDGSDPTGEHDLRPYGKGGALICYLCAIKPENVAAVEANIVRALDAAIEQGNGVVGIDPDAGFFPVGGVRQ